MESIFVGDVVRVDHDAPNVHTIAGAPFPTGDVRVIARKPAKGRTQLEVQSPEGMAWSVPETSCTLVTAGERRSLSTESRREVEVSSTPTTLKASSAKRTTAKSAAPKPKPVTSKPAPKSTAKRTTAKPSSNGKVRVEPRTYKGQIAYKMSKRNADRNADAFAALKSGQSVEAVSKKFGMSVDYLNRLFKISA